MYTAKMPIKLPPEVMLSLSASACIRGSPALDMGPFKNKLHKPLEVMQQGPYNIFSILSG